MRAIKLNGLNLSSQVRAATTAAATAAAATAALIRAQVTDLTNAAIASAASAATWADLARDISNIEVPDDVVDVLVRDPLSATAEALRGLYSPLGFSVAPESFGAVGDGITDDTAAIQAAIAAIALLSTTGGAVVLTQKYLITEVTITDPNIRLTGGGTLAEGTIAIGTDGTGAPYDRLDVRIDNLHFVRATQSGTVNAITAARAYGIVVDDVAFENYNAAFYVRSQSFTGADTHHVARVRLSRLRTKDCNFVLRTTAYTSGGGLLACADFLLTDCQEIAVLDSHVFCEGIDGLSVLNNTMFMPGYNQFSATKRWNVRVDGGAQIIVAGNQLFEAGYEGVHISRGQNLVVADNQIIFPGQRVRSAAVRISDGDTGGLEFCLFSVTGNVVMFPSLHGFSVEDNCGHGVIDGNTVRAPGISSYYYGAPDGTPADYISTEATTTNVRVGAANQFSTGSGTPRVRVLGATSTGRAAAQFNAFMPAGMTPTGHQNFANFDYSSAYPFGVRAISSSAVDDFITHTLDLQPGTYTVDLWHNKGVDRGIYSVLIDNVVVGTIDGYAAAPTNGKDAVTGIQVKVGGRLTLALAMKTKNASSSAYRGAIHALAITRTGNVT